MGIFSRKKQAVEVSAIKLINELKVPFTPFGNQITKSDVVMICIDRVASQCAKLKGIHIKRESDGVQTTKSSDIAYLLKHRPNELMTPYQFIYKLITLLFLNDNVFIYPKYDKLTYELLGLYPLNPTMVEPMEDEKGEYFLKFYYSDGTNYTLPYENVIHIKRFYGRHDFFGGSNSNSDHDTLLKTLRINESLLQGVETAMLSSFQIKGLLKINGMLKESDKQKQLEEFNRALQNSTKSDSSIVPVDAKAEYVPLTSDPKLVDEKTLDFIQSKILDYFGVSKSIFMNKYDETEFNAFYESTIEPLAIQLSETFSTCLLSKKQLTDGEEIVFFSERLQYASWNTKVNAINSLMGLGVMSLNESRALLGLEPVEDGNKRLQSLNYVDASKANEYQVGGNENDEK